MPVTPANRHRSALSSHVPFPPLPEDSPINIQLERIVRSRTFSKARRSQLFLRYILLHAEAHPGEQLKEYSIAVDVFDRDSSYDPAVNNTVRVEAGRLRSRLLEYYAHEGQADPLVIEVPKGSYRVRIHQRDPISAPPEVSAAKKPRESSGGRTLTWLWTVSLAFLIGALVGYRSSQ